MIIEGIAIQKLSFVILAMWCVYLIVEVLRRHNIVHGELARKSIHVGVGIIFASMPLYMNRREMFAVAALFFIGMVIFSGFLRLSKAYEDVSRWTLGQFTYPLGIMLVIYFFDDPHIYTFSVLVLALADAAAALVGKWIGYKRYYVLGGDKTLAGSLAFFSVALTLLIVFVFSFSEDIDTLTIVMIPITAWFLTGVEALLAGGFDNLALPISSAAILAAFV